MLVQTMNTLARRFPERALFPAVNDPLGEPGDRSAAAAEQSNLGLYPG